MPVVPEVLRAKVRVFIELYRKTRQLEAMNAELEKRVAERTAELEAQTEQLRRSEERRSIALAAGDMGSWEVDLATGRIEWDDGPYRIFGVDRATFEPTVERIEAMMHPDDREKNSVAAIVAARPEPLPGRVPHRPPERRDPLVLRRRHHLARCRRQRRCA